MRSAPSPSKTRPSKFWRVHSPLPSKARRHSSTHGVSLRRLTQLSSEFAPHTRPRLSPSFYPRTIKQDAAAHTEQAQRSVVDACIRWTRGMRASKEVATRIATLYQGTSLPQSQSHSREYATPAAAVVPSASHSAIAADRAMFSSALESSIDAYWNVEVAFTRSFDEHLQSQFQPGLTKLLLRSDVTADGALVRNAASHAHAGMLGLPVSPHQEVVCLYFLV
jgi:hypothetical protein